MKLPAMAIRLSNMPVVRPCSEFRIESHAGKNFDGFNFYLEMYFTVTEIIFRGK